MNRIKVLFSSLIILGATFGLPAQAQGAFNWNHGGGHNNNSNNTVEVLTIDMNNQVYRRNSVIYLKQEIQRAYPRKNLNRANLQMVTLYAKSRAGRGTAELQIDQIPMDRKTIDDSRNFASDALRTFNEVRLNAVGREDRGSWQVILDGNIKVNRIEVRIRNHGGNGGGNTPPPPPISKWEVVGSGSAGYFVAGTQQFNVNAREVETIKIEARGSLFMQVPEVWVQYRNGQTHRLPALEGEYNPQIRSKQVNIADRNIQRIWVTALSFGFGAASSYEVSVKSIR